MNDGQCSTRTVCPATDTVSSPDVLNRDEAVVVRGMLDEALEEPLPLPSQWHREYDENTDGIDRANIIGEPHTRALPWLELCRHPRILDAVEAALGPNLILVYSSVITKIGPEILKRWPGTRTITTGPVCTARMSLLCGWPWTMPMRAIAPWR